MRFVRPALALTAALAAFSATAAFGDTITVHVFDFDFSANPDGQPIVDPTINLGDTINWIWDSGFHSVTSVAGSAEAFNSGNFLPPFAFSHTFTRLGTFEYYCDIHGFDNGDGTASGMAGTITVVPAPASGGLIVAAGLFAARRRRPLR